VTAALLTNVLGGEHATPSACVLAAVLVGPVRVALKMPTMAAHTLLLCFAVMFALTPPVALLPSSAGRASRASGTVG